ncbi:uncharacterized protein LOC143152299 isoform X3 [Ptiloglossa arizonensis]|uniref:uncharacterized protein LOC143152299 isoform X3 n=1 Tax=Ptiloglossa arizonensis TaxID=3350558 RepID=UPI003FA1592A
MILNLRSQSTYNSQRNTIFRANFLVWYSRAAVTKIRAFQPFRKYFTANKQCHTRVNALISTSRIYLAGRHFLPLEAQISMLV